MLVNASVDRWRRLLHRPELPGGKPVRVTLSTSGGTCPAG